MQTTDNWLKNWHPFKPEPNEDDPKKSISDTNELPIEKKPDKKEPIEPFEHKPAPGSFEDKYGVII
jgi:hypothetical protein